MVRLFAFVVLACAMLFAAAPPASSQRDGRCRGLEGDEFLECVRQLRAERAEERQQSQEQAPPPQSDQPPPQRRVPAPQPQSPAWRPPAVQNTTAPPATPARLSPGQSSSPGLNVSAGSLTLTWTASQGATHYELGVTDVGARRLIVNEQVRSTSYRVTLEADRDYRWNVAACNAAGCSRYASLMYLTTRSTSTTTGGATECGRGGGSWSGRPVSGSITQDYGVPWDTGEPSDCETKTHTGVDIAAPSGTRVYAVSSGWILVRSIGARWGEAVVVCEQTSEPRGRCSGSARAYLHIVPSRRSGWIDAGEVVGEVADLAPVGSPRGDHLHYNACRTDDDCQHGARLNGAFPGPFLNPRNAAVPNVARPSDPSTPSGPSTQNLAVPQNASPGSAAAPGPAQGSASVRLSWGAVSGATEYDLGVRDMDQDRLVIDQRVRGASFTAALQPGRRYRWNVAACDGATCSRFSTPLYFTTPTQTTTPPPPPTTSLPSTPRGANPGSGSSPGPTQSGSAVQLDWDNVSGAAEYDLGVRDMTTNQLIVDRRVTSSSYSLSNLAAGRTYRWNVAACNSAGCSSFTSALYFTMAGSQQQSGPPSTPRGANPGASSSPGPTQSGASVRLDWDSVSGATEYDVGVRDMTTNRLIVDRRVSSSSVTVSGLEPGRVYRWNVAACNAAGCSSFTTALYFRTAN